MIGDVLATKLFVPSKKSALVLRPRLIEQVSQGIYLGSRLTLVSAPAGFGKTTLVTDWLSKYPDRDSRGPGDDGSYVTWLSLDEGDNDLSGFLTYIIAALQKLDESIGEAAAVMLHAPQPPPTESLLTSLLNDLVKWQVSSHLERPKVLVLDDYHLITAPAIQNAVTFLLENMPPHLHLILITRSDPPLPLSRLRVRGQMSEIRQADLQFTAFEAALFLNNVMGLSLSNDQVETLETRTEGWIAGLQLAALSMRDRDDAAGFVDAFSGSHRFVMDYLAEEVIQEQPDQLQQFIMQTSILGRMSGSLCDAVTGQSKGQESLEILEESNLFLVPLDDDRGWFRYHHLFADVMTSRLQRLSPGQIPELHLRAAKWYQQNNLFAEAIEHALTGKDYQMAAKILESQALSLLKAGSLATLLDWLNKLPSEIVNERPKLGIAAAWVYLLISRLDLVEGYLSTAEDELAYRENCDDLRGEIAAIRTYYAARVGHADQAIELAHESFALLDEDNLTVRSVVAFVLGGVYFMNQEIPRALEAMKEAGRLGEQAGNIHLAVSALSSAGDLHRRQGNLVESERAYYQAMQLGTGRSGNPLPMAASVYSGLAALCLNRNDLTGARQNALIGLELAGKWVNPDSQVGCYITLARTEHMEGNLDDAWEALEKAKQLAANYQLTPGLDEEILACETVISAAPSKGVAPTKIDHLSEYELKVLRLVAAGLSNREVAGELYLSVNTVKWHLKHIYEKLDVHSRVTAVTRAQELDLL